MSINQPNTDKATPRPWHIHPGAPSVVRDEQDTCVAIECGRWDAALIVKAVNNFESLIAALELILPMAKGYAAEHPVGNNAGMVAQASNVLEHL